MKSGSLIRVSLRLLALVFALAASGYLLRPRPAPPPKSVAAIAYTPPTPIVSDEWAHLRQTEVEPISFPGYSVRSTDTYDWLPDGRALLVRHADKTRYHKLYAASPKSVTPFQRFNRKYSRKLYADWSSTSGRDRDCLPPANCLLAPDGKHILWLEDDYVMAAATLDGAMRREWQYLNVFQYGGRSNFATACWMRDGKHWLTPLEEYDEWVGFAVVDSRRSHMCRVTHLEGEIRAGGLPLLGESCDGYILVPMSRSENACIMRFRPDVRQPNPEYVNIHLPLEGQLRGTYLSPKGDKLAWLIQKETKTALWISSATGKFLSLSAPIEVPATLKPGSLRWMPDERHISFLKGEAPFKVALP